MTAQPALAPPPRRDIGHRAAAGLGVSLALGGSLLLAASDSLAKLVLERAPLTQFVVLSGLMILPLLLLGLALSGRLRVLRIGARRALALRCLCMAGSTYFFFAGLQRMPLGDTYAIAFTSPIIALLLAAWLLKEQVGWRRWSAVLAGFSGVVLAMLPTAQGYAWTAALFPLGAAACAALRDVASRRLSATAASLGILFYAVLAVTFGGVCLAPFQVWVDLPAEIFWLIPICAVAQTTAALLQIEAYRYAEVSFLAPFRYGALLFATALGFLIWGDVPAWNVALGSVVIAGSGLFIWYREQRRKRAR